ncbi:MAG: dephospho-CoA kinase [Rhodospirillales bacterium]|nr:dephospho-CoA kinase [Rhodospirillales bacterium]
MIILGLTGSIAMGKTTVAGMFRYVGVPVYDADATVHRMMGPGGEAVAGVEAAFPGVTENGAVNRGRLGAEVFGDDEALGRLEAVLHPLVRREQTRFLKMAAGRRARLVVLDVPLLFETIGEDQCDLIAVVSASKSLQRRRVLLRPGMTVNKLNAILARQVPDGEKRRRADFIIDTGMGRRHSLRQVQNIVRLTRRLKGRHWPPIKPR